MKKKGLGIATMALFVGMMSGCSATETINPTVSSIPTVHVMEAGSGQTYVASGVLTPLQEIQVAPKMAGVVERVTVDEGDQVKRGQLLFQIESDIYEEQLRQAEAGLKAAQARLQEAKSGSRPQEIEKARVAFNGAQAAYDLALRNYERMKRLADEGAIPQAQLDQAKAQLDSAQTALETAKASLDLVLAGTRTETIQALQAQVEQMQASVELNKTNLANTKVYAPVSGIVSKRNVDPGEMASPTVPAFTLVNIDKVFFVANVPAEFIKRLKVGQKVWVRVTAVRNEPFVGFVDTISPQANPNSITFPVKIKIDNKQHLLRAGMMADLFIPTDASGKALYIPKSAVITKNGIHQVFVVHNGKAVATRVKLGPEHGEMVEVTSGLSPKDQVIVSNVDQLSNGESVQVVK